MDKFKTCKACPDRVVGCHSTCEGYQFRCKEREEFLRKERESKFKPTAQREKTHINYYKKQKKYKIYKR